MLSVVNLTKAYGTQVVFDAVSFTVGDGERVGLVGRNGSGKTTLLRLITGQEEARLREHQRPQELLRRLPVPDLPSRGASVLSEASGACRQRGRDRTRPTR